MSGLNPLPGPPDCLRHLTLSIPAEELPAVLAGHRKILNLPAESILVSCWIETSGTNDRPRSVVVLRLEHPSFEPVEPGLRLPRAKALIGHASGKRAAGLVPDPRKPEVQSLRNGQAR